jgi:hypothetical protein
MLVQARRDFQIGKIPIFSNALRVANNREKHVFATQIMLAAVFLLGGVGRVVSLLVYRQSQSFQLTWAAMESALLPVHVARAAADTGAVRRDCRRYR